MRQVLPEHIHLGEKERLMLLTALDVHLQHSEMGQIIRAEYERLEQLIKWWDKKDTQEVTE